VLSGLFLVIQIVLLLGFIYAINEALIDKEEIGHKFALVGATVSMYAVGLVVIGFMYHLYAPFPSCSLNIFFITWTLIMGVAYSVFSVRPANLHSLSHSAIFSSAFRILVWASTAHGMPHMGVQ
jgi:hypothetical protein